MFTPEGLLFFPFCPLNRKEKENLNLSDLCVSAVNILAD